MDESIVKATGITMSYQKRQVLGGLNLTVKKGEICGLLGPNGSGKTTLLKVLTGLALPEQGEVHLFGRPFAPEALRRTGCIVSKPSIYKGKTAGENIRIRQTLLGIPEDQADALLDRVGLSGTGNKKAGKFSLGMKQRLGIAMALLGTPDLLLLDEPFNGLDTQGVYDVRDLLQRLNTDQGVTIVITSHLLDEVARLATCYAILKNGAIQQFSGEQLRESSGQYAEIITDSPQAAAVVLDGIAGGEKAYEVMPDGSFRLYQELDRLPELNAALVSAGIGVRSFSLKTRTLVDFYLDETGGKPHA